MLREEGETLEEYVEEDVVEFDEDDDINDGGDIQDISMMMNSNYSFLLLQTNINVLRI